MISMIAIAAVIGAGPIEKKLDELDRDAVRQQKDVESIKEQIKLDKRQCPAAKPCPDQRPCLVYEGDKVETRVDDVTIVHGGVLGNASSWRLEPPPPTMLSMQSFLVPIEEIDLREVTPPPKKYPWWPYALGFGVFGVGVGVASVLVIDAALGAR